MQRANFARWMLCSFALALLAGAASANDGQLTLKDGTTLRGDITESEREIVIVTNGARKHFPRAQVARVQYDAQAASSQEPEQGGDDARASQRNKGAQPPPMLSAKDILRLKLSEFPLDGPPEKVNVRFLKRRGETDLEKTLEKDFREAADIDPGWERVLERGRPNEKLQLILRTTGLKYADRIEIRGDTETFATFRREILPLTLKGCARSGCHGGTPAHVFRFPSGVATTDDYVYTSFVILDSLHTRNGPMLDRNLPENSALLKYLMPAESGPPPHPPVKTGRVQPMIESRRDPAYKHLLDWINTLRVPHPEYGLEYQGPEWLKEMSQPLRRAAEDEPRDDGEAPSSGPTSVP